MWTFMGVVAAVVLAQALGVPWPLLIVAGVAVLGAAHWLERRGS